MDPPPPLYDRIQTRPFEDDLEKGIQREECAICLDNTEETCNTWVQLKDCSHAFHQPCIDSWIASRENPTCPLCQRIIRPSQPNTRLTERQMTLRREFQEKWLCAVSCLCCLAVFIVPPVMMFVGKN